MSKKSRKNIMFTTRRQSSSGELKKFSLILTSCVLGILVISCLAILKKYDFDVKSALGGNAETETVTEAVSTQAVKVDADKNYLFWCSDDGSLRFAWLVNIKLPERTATVCTLEKDTVLEYEGTETSFDSIYSKWGESRLAQAVAEYADVEIDGYIGSTDDEFKSMINYFGGIDITVPEQIEYKSEEFSVILIKGKQNLKGDSLFKYLRYLNTLGSRGRSLQASAVLEILDYVFKPAYMGRRSNIFSRLSNTLETNLTIVDFSSSEEGIKFLMKNGFSAKKTAETVEEFKKFNEG